MLFLLVGPFAFFSNMRFVATYNPVNDISLKFSMNIVETDPNYGIAKNYDFDLFETSSPTSIREMTKD
jgi:hypothetical protein